MSNTLLPAPVGIVWSDGMPHHTYAKGQLLAHAAAATAAKDAEIAGLREELDRLRQVQRSLSDKLTAERERIKVLEDALRGVMSGCKYSCIAGEWHWHEKSIATNAALDAARAALGDKNG